MNNQNRNAQEVQNNEQNEVTNANVQTNEEVQTNEQTKVCVIKAVKCFDDNLQLETNGLFVHINENGAEVTNSYLNVSKDKGIKLIKDLGIFPNLDLPDFAFGLLVNTKISVTKENVKKGEEINGFKFENDGYHFKIEVVSNNFSAIQQTVFNKLLEGILNNQYTKQKKQMQNPFA